MNNDRTAALTNLAAPLAASLGLELWGVELAGSSRPVLRVFVERLPEADSQSAESAGGHPDSVNADALNAEDSSIVEGVGSEGVSVEQCAELSRLMGLNLDVDGPFAGAWTLEVSSPGLERLFFRLDQMRPYVGREVDVALLDGHPQWPVTAGAALRKKFCGELVRVDTSAFTLKLPPELRKPEDPEEVDIEWETVRRATLVHTFREPGLPKKSQKAAGGDKAGEKTVGGEQPAKKPAKKPGKKTGAEKNKRSETGGTHES